MFKEGPWSVLRELDDPDLRRLADALRETVLKSRADSTIKKYLGAFKLEIVGIGLPTSRISSSCTPCCSLPAVYSTD